MRPVSVREERLVAAFGKSSAHQLGNEKVKKKDEQYVVSDMATATW